jgi:hypothetical protein
LDHDGGSHDGLQCTIGEGVVADHMAPRTWFGLWNFKDYYLSRGLLKFSPGFTVSVLGHFIQ